MQFRVTGRPLLMERVVLSIEPGSPPSRIQDRHRMPIMHTNINTYDDGAVQI
jgi:hypothetical protein